MDDGILGFSPDKFGLELDGALFIFEEDFFFLFHFMMIEKEILGSIIELFMCKGANEVLEH